MFRAYGSFPSNGDNDHNGETTESSNATTTTNTPPANNSSNDKTELLPAKQIDLFDIILNQNATTATSNLLWNSNTSNNATISCSLINDFNNLLVSTSSQISSRPQQQQHHHQEQQYNQQSLDNLYGMAVVTKSSTLTTTSSGIITNSGISTNINKIHNNRYNFTGNVVLTIIFDIFKWA